MTALLLIPRVKGREKRKKKGMMCPAIKSKVTELFKCNDDDDDDDDDDDRDT